MPAAPPPPEGPASWFWPPPGATVQGWDVLERGGAAGTEAGFCADPDERPDDLHLRALTWLLDEHPRADRTDAGDRRFRLDVARTEMPGGRVGHRYALDGAPLGATGSEDARGALWRWVQHLLAGGP